MPDQDLKRAKLEHQFSYCSGGASNEGQVCAHTTVCQRSQD
jgi:hypothetical protein